MGIHLVVEAESLLAYRWIRQLVMISSGKR